MHQGWEKSTSIESTLERPGAGGRGLKSIFLPPGDVTSDTTVLKFLGAQFVHGVG